MQYLFKIKPYSHQEKALNFIWDKKGAALFMEMGTGKSKIIIDEIMNKRVNALILCPNSVKYTWQEEILKNSFKNYDVLIFKNKLYNNFIIDNGNIKLLIIAIESLSNGCAFEYAYKFLSLRTNYLIIDESLLIKNFKAIRTKNCWRLSMIASNKRILTGTPLSKGIEDLYSQYYTLSPDIMGHKSYYTFRNRYCVMGGFQQKKIISYKNINELTEKIKPFTFTITKKECLDLPEKIYEKRIIEMSEEQKTIYKKYKQGFIKDVKKILKTNKDFSLFNNNLTQMLRLHQISGGFMQNEDRTITYIKNNEKLQECISLCNEYDGKIIIWCRYIPEIKMLEKYFKEKCVIACGQISTENRNLNIKGFNEDKSIKIFIGQVDSMSMGITLNSSSFTIYYSNSWNASSRIQSEDRNHRIGQKNQVLYIDLINYNTIDILIFKALQKKQDLLNYVIEELRENQQIESLFSI